jgi:uncharacterized membrane protein (DUF485 family)
MAKSSPRTGPLWPWLRPWHVGAVITLLVGILFRDVLLGKAFFWEDFIYQYYAFRDFAAVSLANGHLPLWNPYTFSGMPFQADIQTAVFYLPNMLLTLFVSGEKLPFFWVEALIIAHFVVAGVSMAYLAEEFGLERPYALFCGVVYALSGFMITHAIHHTFISQVPWVPLILVFFRRAILRRSPGAMIIAGLVLALSILGGAPQFTLYTFLFLLAYFLFEFISALRTVGFTRAWTMAPVAAGVIALAIALTAIQLLPTFELAGLSQRATITFEKSSESSLVGLLGDLPLRRRAGTHRPGRGDPAGAQGPDGRLLLRRRCVRDPVRSRRQLHPPQRLLPRRSRVRQVPHPWKDVVPVHLRRGPPRGLRSTVASDQR